MRILGDVGGQSTLRPYWRNYFEQTDALVWVVDSSDRMRMGDCKTELHALLMEEVRTRPPKWDTNAATVAYLFGILAAPSRCISTRIRK